MNMKFLDTEIAPLGMGCWPIAGAMYGPDGTSLGYSNSDDAESIKAIHAALDNGISLFDTAAAYGAGHSERLLAKALKHRPDAVVVTKIGIGIDEQSKVLSFDDFEAAEVIPAIDACLRRLERDCVDVVMLHLNSLPPAQAEVLFDEMDKARLAGKIKSFGWSTDFTASAKAMASRPGFVAVEHAMHVLMDAPNMQQVVHDNDLYALIRSPLAMGLLSGKYTIDSSLPKGDIRTNNQDWTKYYIDGKPNPEYIERFNAVRELIQTDGRTAVQGALAWLWAKHPQNIPIPGARTVEQIEGLAAALSFGALPTAVMDEVDALVGDSFVSEGESER